MILATENTERTERFEGIKRGELCFCHLFSASSVFSVAKILPPGAEDRTRQREIEHDIAAVDEDVF